MQHRELYKHVSTRITVPANCQAIIYYSNTKAEHCFETMLTLAFDFFILNNELLSLTPRVQFVEDNPDSDSIFLTHCCWTGCCWY